MKQIRAYYKFLNGSRWGHLSHFDDGNGKPLCGNQQASTKQSSPPLWVHCVDAVTCQHCCKKAAELPDDQRLTASEVEAGLV